jgi:hypothetical protein
MASCFLVFSTRLMARCDVTSRRIRCGLVIRSNSVLRCHSVSSGKCWQWQLCSYAAFAVQQVVGCQMIIRDRSLFLKDVNWALGSESVSTFFGPDFHINQKEINGRLL